MTSIFGDGFLATVTDRRNQCPLGRTGGTVAPGLVASRPSTAEVVDDQIERKWHTHWSLGGAPIVPTLSRIVGTPRRSRPEVRRGRTMGDFLCYLKVCKLIYILYL